MALARRSFLRAMVAAPVAGKAAAADMARSTALQQAGIASVLGDGSPPPSMGAVGASLGNSDDTPRKILGLIKNIGFPEWKQREMRERAKWIHKLDPDLAANRSFSLAGKISVQQKRNYQRIMAGETDQYQHQFERDSWLKRNGLGWW